MENAQTVRLARQITTVGNSVGITLPRELLDAYGLQKGALIEVRANRIRAAAPPGEAHANAR